MENSSREEIELPAQSDLHRIFDFTPSPNPGATMSQQSCVYSVPFSNNGGVCRVHQPPCFAPAIDVYYPKSLPNGFIVTAFSLVPSTPTDSGNGDGFGYSGNHVFTPGYEIVSWGDAKTAVGPNRQDRRGYPDPLGRAAQPQYGLHSFRRLHLGVRHFRHLRDRAGGPDPVLRLPNAKRLE
jgi:hypothetical protein